MLQQILRDMYIDPEILEELSDDQKQILFFKMREEQIRRWKVNEEKLAAEDKLKPPVIKRPGGKHVNFYCDENSDLIIEYIAEPDEIDESALKKKLEEEALRKAEEQAKKEADLKRKELEEIERKRREEIRRKEEADRLRKLQEEKEEEARRKAEEEAANQSLKAAKLQKEKEEAEKKILEEKKRMEEEEKKRLEEEQKREVEIRMKEEIERKRREEELAEEERKRKEEIYEKMKQEQEEKRKREEEESKQLEDEWKEREVKAKAADQLRRNSFSYSKNEFERMRKLAKEKAELEKMRKADDISAETTKFETMRIDSKSIPESIIDPFVSKSATVPKTRGHAIKRPPLPSRPEALRPTISTPVNVTSTCDEVDTIPVQKEVIRPSRPPPPPSKGSPVLTHNTVEKKEGLKSKKNDKPNRPPRPKSKMEVLTWWKEVEYPKLSGLDEEKKPMEWFHGIITRHEAEKLLGNKKQGSYLVRVSERVWGYTISFKDIGRCKHFLIDTIHGGYQFFGMEQIVHNSLNELVEYHKKNPISGLGQEILSYPCGQEKSRPDYEHLFVDSTPV